MLKVLKPLSMGVAAQFIANVRDSPETKAAKMLGAAPKLIRLVLAVRAPVFIAFFLIISFRTSSQLAWVGSMGVSVLSLPARRHA